ncbi:hypothetical protein Tco_1166014, partial [Tanacetum coccineum]
LASENGDSSNDFLRKLNRFYFQSTTAVGINRCAISNSGNHTDASQFKGTPIQANMDIKDADYFHQLLQLKKAYIITEILNDGFPEHYFNFASYNELPARADVRIAILTGDATTNRIRRRTIDIQDLNGNTIVLTLWHEMALNFNVQEYEAMEKPVAIAVVSSCLRMSEGSRVAKSNVNESNITRGVLVDLSTVLSLGENTSPKRTFHALQDDDTGLMGDLMSSETDGSLNAGITILTISIL